MPLTWIPAMSGSSDRRRYRVRPDRGAIKVCLSDDTPDAAVPDLLHSHAHRKADSDAWVNALDLADFLPTIIVEDKNQ